MTDHHIGYLAPISWLKRIPPLTAPSSITEREELTA